MPRTPKPPSYRKHSSGQAFVRLKGRNIYLGVHGTPESKRRYQQFLAQWVAGEIVSTAPSPSIAPAPDLTVTEAIAAYDAYASIYYVKDGKPTGQLERVRRSLAVVREIGDAGESPGLE